MLTSRLPHMLCITRFFFYKNNFVRKLKFAQKIKNKLRTIDTRVQMQMYLQVFIENTTHLIITRGVFHCRSFCSAKHWGHPHKLFRFPSPDRPTFFKIPFKDNKTDPYFLKFSEKKDFNLKELYYFEIIFLILIFFLRPTDQTFRVGGRWETKHLWGWPEWKEKKIKTVPLVFYDSTEV